MDRQLAIGHHEQSENGCDVLMNSSCFASETRRVTVKQDEHHLIWKSC